MSQPGPVPQLDPPEPITPEPTPTTGITELDRAVAILMRQFAHHLDGAVDEVYQALSYAYPGLYADPDAPTSSRVEYRVTETNGHQRHLLPAAAVHAHRLGLRVERRVVTATEWETEPNPNSRVPRPIPEHPQMETAEGLTPPGYPVGLTPIPADEAAETQPLAEVPA